MSQDDDTAKRGELVLVGDIPLDVPGAGELTARQQARHFTTLDQVAQLVEARNADPKVGFMARLLALCTARCGRAEIFLGSRFFQEVITNPVPIDMHVLRAVKRSPLGLDLYLWLTYRTFNLPRPLRLKWPLLYRQFGGRVRSAPDDRVAAREGVLRA